MIHKTAIISETAIIGSNVIIGAYTVVADNVVIGNDIIIGSNVFIEHAQIGRNCKIYNSVSIGTPPQDLSYDSEPSKVYIDENTTIREFVTINRGTKKTAKTTIGKNCYLMASSHIAHDCRIGSNVIMANSSAAGGHVEIGDNAFISGFVGIHQFTKIGRDTMVGVGSVVTMDIVPYALCVGDRVRLNGLNLIGMKRRKISQAEISAVKEAYQIIFKSKLLLQDALVKLDQIQSDCVKEIIGFIRNSKRGIVRP